MMLVDKFINKMAQYHILCFIFFFYVNCLYCQRTIGEEYYAECGLIITYGKFEYRTREFINEYARKNNEDSLDVDKLASTCNFCQGVIYDGDTVHYTDANGLRQGLWIDYCFPKGIYWLRCSGVGLFPFLCPSCDYIEKRNYYKNDTLQYFITFGYKDGILTDTLEYIFYNYKTGLSRSMMVVDTFSEIRYGMTDNNNALFQGEVKVYDLQTKKLKERGNRKDNKYCDSVDYYYQDGSIEAEAFYDNEHNKFFYRFYRKNGIKSAEVFVENGIIVDKYCFDEKGLAKIVCDSTKTLTDELKQ